MWEFRVLLALIDEPSLPWQVLSESTFARRLVTPGAPSSQPKCLPHSQLQGLLGHLILSLGDTQVWVARLVLWTAGLWLSIHFLYLGGRKEGGMNIFWEQLPVSLDAE